MTKSIADVLDSLAERVEGLEDAHSETDLDIALAVSPDQSPPAWQLSFVTHDMEPLRFTASLDAAMTLADESDIAELLSEAMDALGQSGWREGGYREALARFFTAACLRARAAKARGEVE